MAYEVTATRKRPRNFTSLVGQEFVVATLMNALKIRHIANAYLFSGSRGVGKTSAARLLARALNCPDESLLGTEECFNYSGAEDISRGVAMDVIEIDGASNTSVNDVRVIRDEILFPPQNSRYKIYIIDEVHMLSNSAFNALLKTIEEPPHYVVFIFATTEIHKVPATIRSRCQQFTFRLIPQSDIIALLHEACADATPPITAEDDALFWIAREAAGSMRDAYTILDQVAAFSDTTITLEKIKTKLGLLGIDELNTLAGHIVAGEQKASIEYLDNILSASVAVEQLVIALSDYFRSILFITQGIERDGLLGYPRKAFSEKVIKAFTVTQLEKALEMLLQTYRDVRYTLNDRFELELLISRLHRLHRYFEPDEIIGQIEDLRRSIGSMPEAVSEGSMPETVPEGSMPETVPEGSMPEKAMPEEAMPEEAMPEEAMPEEAMPEGARAGTVSEADGTISAAMWQQIVKGIRSQQPGIATILENCSQWEQVDKVLKIGLESQMQIGMLRQNEKVISDTIKTLYAIDVTFDLYLLEGQQQGSAENPQVAKITEFFDGKVIK